MGAPVNDRRPRYRVTYLELLAAWWAIHRSHPSSLDDSVRLYLTTKVFTELLRQSGWTVAEWSAANDAYRKAKADRA